MGKKVLVIDNYDSFVYNLVHLIRELGYQPDIYRNDKIALEKVGEYDKILLSPGPGIPSEAGLMPEIIKEYAPSKSMFGVCLGHQAIGEAFGAELYNLPKVLHGVDSKVRIASPEETVLFKGLPERFRIAHYHSWVINKETVEGTGLEATSFSDDGEVMSIAHKNYDVRGVQFHPESVLTEHGKQIVDSWLKC